MPRRSKPVMDRPTEDGWADLYRKASAVKELAPWSRLMEDQLFAMEFPAGSPPAFVQVMGHAGEHLAVAVYAGRDGLSGLFQMLGEGLEQAEEFLEIPQLQVSWEDRQLLTARDREVIRSLGLKFRGRQAWPLFRSYRAGFVPWYLEPDEVTLLGHALDQLLALFPRLCSAQGLLDVGRGYTCPLRRAVARGGELKWADETLDLEAWMASCDHDDMPAAYRGGHTPDGAVLDRLGELDWLETPLQIDLFALPGTIDERDGRRPRQAYILVALDGHEGFVLHQRAMEAVPSWEAMLASAEDWFVELCETLQCVPETVYLRRPALADVLLPLATALEVELMLADRLPAVAHVRDELYRMMGMD